MVVQEQVSAGRAGLQVFLLRLLPGHLFWLLRSCCPVREGSAVGSHVPVASVGRFCDGSSTSPWLPSLHLGEEALPLEEAGGNQVN